MLTPRPTPKIALIGAGSAVFTRNLLGDVFSYPALKGCEIALHDIDERRLHVAERLAARVAQAAGATPRITATLDRRRALDGARYVVNTIQVGGYRPATVADFEIPKRYGLRQTIGDTLGIGGIMRGLRTLPVMLEMLRDMDACCASGALHLNYVNPMAIITWALNAVGSRVPTVGLCHSVQHTAAELARDLGIPEGEIDYLCAGINHMSFYLWLEHRGQALAPRLMQLIAEGRVPAHNRVRYEMFQRLGYFVTESSEHFSEYVPWFIKPGRDDLIEKYNIPLDEYPGRCELFDRAWPYIERELDAPGSQDPTAFQREFRASGVRVMDFMLEREAPRMITGLRENCRSLEYGSAIVNAMETGQPIVINGNVRNHGLIDNLPAGCAVEVPCLVDSNGVQPTRVGSLPVHLAALMRSNVSVQELVVEAVLQRKPEHVFHAAMLDPHTADVLDLEQIDALVRDLLSAHRALLPEYLHV